MRHRVLSFFISTLLIVVAHGSDGPPLLAQQTDAEESIESLRPFTPLDVALVRSVGQVAIRPDGSEIAYTLTVPREPGVDENGSAWTELHVIGFDGTDDRPFVSGAVNVSQLRWSPDGRYLAYLARREGDDYRSIYVIPAAAGESMRLVEYKTNIEAFDWRPDGRAIAFVATEPVSAELEALRKEGYDQTIYEEDYRTRRAFVVELPDGPSGVASEPRMLDAIEGHPWRAVWSPDGRRLLVDVSPTPLIDDRYMYRRLRVVDAGSGATLASIDNPGKLGDFAWSPDGESIAVISAADINDPAEGRLMVVSAEGGEFRDLLPGLEGHVEAFEFAERGRIVYLAAVGVGSRLGRVRTNGDDDEVLYDGDAPVLDAITLDAGGRRLALIAESATMAREVFAMEPRRSTVPSRLTDVNPWFAEIEFGRREPFRWMASDGLEIEGLLIHPLARAEGERVPTIIVAHGGPESHFKNGWITTYSRPGQVAAGRGYALLYPNYRGSTGRGVAFAKGDQGDGVGAEFEDVLAGIDALVEQGIADPDRIGITGGSYGGYFTGWAATRYSDRFAAGVMLYGVANQLSKTGTSDITNELELVHWLTNPYDERELFMERSPILYVDDAKTPLLILHGEEDARVYPGQTLEMYRGLKLRGDAPVRAVFYPDEGHGFRTAAHRYDCSLRIIRWFDHFLVQGQTEMPAWEVDYRLKKEVM